MTIKRLLCVTVGGRCAREELSAALGDWEINQVAGLNEARDALHSHQHMVGMLLLDAECSPLEALDRFLCEHWWLKWVALFHPHALQLPPVRQLIHDHCFDFHTWPIDGTRLNHTLGHAHGLAALAGHTASDGGGASMPLTGNSDAILSLRQQIRKVAQADAPVLIWGESGTGKELVARAVHENSPRAGAPFVPVNCGAMPASLIQSELFGYEKGAFTGAARDKHGLIESAAGGSLFLDEIGDLPLDLQSNLLRFLQEKTICRLGGTRQLAVDVRVIAASHVKLSQAVERGAFREDLYYRLNVLALEVPPLRERRDDVAALAEHYFRAFATERAAQVRGFSGKALEALRHHNWPGNVRELVNRVRRALVMAEGRMIQAADLGLSDTPADAVHEAPPCERLGGARNRAERTALEERLASGKNMTQVASELGISRMTLYRLMARHGIDLPSRRRER
ncbi:sigma-54-dependent Fis family transcriptional regulator [Massilia sp. BJB1822]|nr:sigma-54-dependent Fis family transcriptional regulator [Massilia sp. BJB1822]